MEHRVEHRSKCGSGPNVLSCKARQRITMVFLLNLSVNKTTRESTAPDHEVFTSLRRRCDLEPHPRNKLPLRSNEEKAVMHAARNFARTIRAVQKNFFGFLSNGAELSVTSDLATLS